jgi:hypothetical protein
MKFLASPDERPKGVTFFELVNSQHALKFLKMVELFSIPIREWKNYSFNPQDPAAPVKKNY